MVHHQNTSEIKPKHISTDKHGINALNFALFDLTDLVFAPRIPKPHKETLWGFGAAKDYDGLLIRPTQFVDEKLLEQEWDNMQRLVASILVGETAPSVIIRKLSSNNYTSNTKRAFVQYNHIVRSRFILSYLHDYEFRRAIMYALNRGELYNSLYRSIAILNNGELKGKNEIEMEIWNQCTRFIAAIIHFYNAYILNSFYIKADNKEEKEILAKLSPTAWTHINLLGYYQFCNGQDDKSTEKIIDQWLGGCNWQTKNTTHQK
jgi:TnpA family transposase